MRSKELGQRLSANVIFEAVIEQGAEVRSPFAEIIVDVDDGEAFIAGTSRERSEALGHRKCVLKELLAAIELQVVDDVDDEKNDCRFFGDVAVEVVVLRGH